MTINVDLLQRTMERIEQHPDQWQQDTWAVEHYQGGVVCRTAFCFAGWAVQLAGHTIAFSGEPCLGERHTNYVDDGDSIEALAQWKLGLTYEQAWRLFDAANDLPTLRSIVAEFIEETWRANALHDAVAELVEEAERSREKELVA